MKIPYIESYGNQSKTTASVDFIILDGSNPVIISILDIGVKVRKIVSDLIVGSQSYSNTCVLRDREDSYSKFSLSSWGKSFKYKTEKQGKFTHTIIHLENVERDYCIDWKNDNKAKTIAEWMRTKHYIPVNEKIVQILIDFQNRNKSSYYYNEWCQDLTVICNNPNFQKTKAYKVNVSYFISLMGRITINDYDSDFDWDEVVDLEDYILTFTDSIREKLEENIHVLFNPNKIDDAIFSGNMKPYKGQIPIIQSGIEVLRRQRALYIGGEMGIGKTLISTIINNVILGKSGKNYETLVVAPAITLTQWKKEIENILGDSVYIFIIRSSVDFIRERNNKHDKPTYYLVGKETFKLDAKKKAGIIVVKRQIKARVKEISNNDYWWNKRETVVSKKIKVEICQCPSCGKPLKNENKTSVDYFLSSSDFEDKPRKSTYKCSNCDTVLWQSVYDKTKKTSLINYLQVKNIKFDSVICDEAHESNNSNSIIGNAIRTLFSHGKKIILLSGTSNNGYASSMHNILLGLFPRKIVEDGVLNVDDFIKKYGTLQAVSKQEDGVYYRSGRSRIKDSDFVEIEGLNPVVFTKYLAENYIFANLSDLEKDLPNLVEKYIPIVATEKQEEYENKLSDEIKKANSYNFKMYQDSIIRHYVNNPFGWNNPIEISGMNGVKVVIPTNLENSNIVLPKEEMLIEICKQEKQEGRKVWVYTDFSGESGDGQYMNGTNIPERLKNILESEGLKVYWLKPNVKPIDRKELIEKNIDKHDVFISNPKLVNVGINLTWCPTYVNFIPSYHVNIVSQSSRRGYRANSSLENRIYYLYYHNSCEKNICERFQRKSLEARAIEGRFNVATEDENIRTASKLSSRIDSALTK